MDEKGVAYFVFSLIMPLVALSLLPSLGSGILQMLSLAVILIAIALLAVINWADFILFSFLMNVLHVTFQPAMGYKIVRGQDAVVKEVNGLFYATGFMTANLFGYTFKQETAESDEAGIAQAPERWEKAVTGLGFPFKYHVLSSGMDVQKVRDGLEGQRSYQEFQLSRTLQSNRPEGQVAIGEIQRKIDVIQSRMDRIASGERPVATLMYIETTAVGVSERAALDALTGQVKSVQIAMSSMDVELSRVIGRELHTLFNFNFAVPSQLSEISELFDQQG